MYISIQHPSDKSVLRNSLPQNLYTFDNTPENAADVLAPTPFPWEDLAKSVLEAHLNNKLRSSSFISAYSEITTACRQNLNPDSSSSTILTIDTKYLVPAWSVQSGTHFPIWIEQGPLPKMPYGVLTMSQTGYEAFTSSVWVCVEEARYALGLECREIEGEWLACRNVPGSMVVRRERVVVMGEKKVGVGYEGSAMRDRGTQTVTGLELGSTSKVNSMQHGKKSSKEQAMQSDPPPKPMRSPPAPSRHLMTVILPPAKPYFPSIDQVLASHSLVKPRSISSPPLSSPRHSTKKTRRRHDSLTPLSTPRPKKQLIKVPEQALLLHPPIRATSALSRRSAETLRRLEDVQLNGEALRMWIGDAEKKHKP